MTNNNSSKGAIIIEGHVQGLSNIRSLGEAGIPAFVVDTENCIARYSQYCQKFFQSPDFIKDEFADFLIDLAIQENIRDWVLIPSNDHAVYTISKHKEKLEKYYKIITPELDIIDLIYDKTKLINLARENTIPVPETLTYHSTEEALANIENFPVLIKGRNGLTFYKKVGKKAFVANDQEELKNHLSLIRDKYDLSKTFTQELIPHNGENKTISFTAFCEKGEIKTHWTGVKLREHPIQFGTATFSQNTHIAECYRHSRKILKSLQYTGVCEIEYLKDPRTNDYKLIEINPRTWLWVELAKASGVDYAKLIYNYMHNNLMEYPVATKETKYWINPLSDFPFSLIGMIRGHIKIRTYLSYLFKRNKVNALFDRTDPKPAFIYMRNVLSYIKNR